MEFCTWTGVEKINRIKFSHDKPGIMQHISECFMCPRDICIMKYIIASMHGRPNTSDTRNAVRHFLISSLQ
jgi:hypothetical protein